MAAPQRPQTGTLTGVFAPGAPPLEEALRTLEVVPRRVATPGETIRVQFVFSNLGGAPATNVRTRFAVPSGVTYVEGSDTLDDQPLPAGVRLVAADGAGLGDLPPNALRRVACSFRVHDRIEDGTELRFQAALITEQTPVIASNVERITVRSAPVLQSSATFATIGGPQEPKPGDLLTIRAIVANTGASGAHDVFAFLPVPEHLRYVPRSARIAGRALLDVQDEPFDYASQRVVAKQLPPGQSVEVEYQASIEAPLADGTPIRIEGAVSSREIAEFALQSPPITVTSPVDFSNEETVLTVQCDDVVTPGTRVPMIVRAVNAGTGDADAVSLRFDLPPGLVYTPGSAHVDGQPVSDDTLADGVFDLGAVPAGRVIEAGISATVSVSAGEDLELPVAATLRWSGRSRQRAAERGFARALRVRTTARFARARNYINADRAVAQAREDASFLVHVLNDGTAPAHGVRLRLLPGAFIGHLRVSESGAPPAAYAEPYELGTVAPHAERVLTVYARADAPVPDRSQASLGAVLDYAGGTVDLGTASVIVRSRAHVAPEGVTWMREQLEPIRPGQIHDLTIRFTNDGADTLRDARIDIALPAELVLERALNARREGNSLLFADVPAESVCEARVAVRLLRAPRGGGPLELEGTLTGRGISPLRFTPLEVPAFAQPQFEEDAQVRVTPGEVIAAGERISYDVWLRNTGDGAADRLSLRAIPSNLCVYVPATTTLNGVMIPDDLGSSQLWSSHGLQLADVNPGAELHVRWEMVVIAPLAAETLIETRAVLQWDGDASLALQAPALRVVSTPSLQAGEAGTPISVARMLPPLQTPAAETIVPPEPQAVPQPAAIAAVPIALPAASVETAPAPIAYVSFTQDELAAALRMIDESDAGGLIAHLFTLRALFPDRVAGAEPPLEQTVANAALAVRAPLDRFFVRLRLPDLSVSAKDLEDRESRFALRALVAGLLEAPHAALATRAPGTLRVSGAIETDRLRALAGELEGAPLGSVSPWIVYAHLLGTRIESDAGESGELAAYRAELLRVFGVLETLPMPEFHRILATSVNRALDDARAAVIARLRAAAPIAAQ